MSEVTLKGNPIHTCGELPKVASMAPAFTLVDNDLNDISLEDFNGKRLVLNIFPSVDTPTCANSVRTFNEKISGMDNTRVLCVSNDLPFAQARFCGAEGLHNVTSGSAFRSSFGTDYGVTFTDGPLKGLLSRAVVVLDEDGMVLYTQQVAEVSEEPDYQDALSALG